MNLKSFLKQNYYTKDIYGFLYHWKYEGLRNAIVLALKPDNALKNNPIIKKIGLSLDSYCLPDILLQGDVKEKNFTIISCANTIYAPEKGHSGGPGTVLATQEAVLGENYNGIVCQYFCERKPVRHAHFSKALDEMPISKRFLIASFAIEHGLDIWKERDRFHDFIFICHDVGTAYGAYLRHCHYVLIYHQQGALVSERISNGDILNERDIEIANNIEQIVFSNADKVYFPSYGARQSFMETTKMDYSQIKFADYPLYNTIPDTSLNEKDYSLLIREFVLDANERENTDVFLSIGDFSYNKGMEQVPEFLIEYCKKCHRKVYWIAIGRKLQAGIFERLVEQKDAWPFKAVLLGERVNHDIILSLMRYSDFYIMLHRHSIFDLSTLEAMRAGNGLILSDIGGNIEYNKENNVVLVNASNFDQAIEQILKENKKQIARRNQEVFQKYFSKTNFYHEYSKMIDEELKEIGYI